MSTNSNTASVTATINMLPIGTVMAYMGTIECLSGLQAQGWYVCNGAQLATSALPELYKVIKNAFGGDSQNFFLPDLRGMFLRGVDTGTGNDPNAATRSFQHPGGNAGAMVGSQQPDDFKAHTHSYNHWVSTNFQIYASGNQWNPPYDVKNGDSTGSVGGLETRPKNVYTWYIIFGGLKNS